MLIFSPLRQGRGPASVRRLVFLASLLATPLGAMSPLVAQTPAARKATLVTLWSPQAQFAGYYVALEKGFYAKRGLDLTIRDAGPGINPEALLRDGAADFAVLWLSSAIRQRAQGTPVVHLAQIVPRSSLLLIARASSGIRGIKDMQGRKVSLWRGDISIPAKALLAAEGVGVREVPQSQTVNLFLRGGVDVTSAMWYNEYHTILDAGINPDELTVFQLHDLGIRFPEDGVYALGPTVARDPAMADAFVRASLEGWRYAFANPDEAIDIVLRRIRAARLPANHMHQHWMLARLEELAALPADTARIPLVRAEDYEAVAAVLNRNMLVNAIPPFRDFFPRANAIR